MRGLVSGKIIDFFELFNYFRNFHLQRRILLHHRFGDLVGYGLVRQRPDDEMPARTRNFGFAGHGLHRRAQLLRKAVQPADLDAEHRGIALLGRIGQVGALAVVPYDDLRTTESLLLHLLLRRTRFVERTVPAGIVGVFPLDLFVSERIGALEEVTAVGAVRIGAEQNPVDRSTLVDLYLRNVVRGVVFGRRDEPDRLVFEEHALFDEEFRQPVIDAGGPSSKRVSASR